MFRRMEALMRLGKKMEEAMRTGNMDLLIEFNLEMAQYNYIDNKTDEAHKNLKTVLEIYEKTHEEDIHAFYLQLGSFCLDMRDVSKSEEFFERAQN